MKNENNENTIGSVQAVLTGRAVAFARGRASAIAKVARSGSVVVGPLGLEGDEQGDTRFHGGRDKAVHLYAREHYRPWVDELGALPVLGQPGAFGENLSTAGVTEAELCLADRLRVGGALLEISQARQPCWKLNDRFGVRDMARRVQDTLRTGWYCRVLEPGEVHAGDAIVLVARPHPDWPLARLMKLLYAGRATPQILREALCLPLVPSWRKLIEGRLSTGVVEDWSARVDGPSG